MKEKNNLDYSIDTPFRTYQDIQEAVKTQKAILSYQRAAAYNIACRANPGNTFLNLIISIISILAMLAACVIFSISKWVLLFGIAVSVLYTLVPHLKRLFWMLSVVLIALPIFVLEGSMWLLAIGVGIVGMIIGYYIWWGLISGIATKTLMADEGLFEMVWAAGKVALKTSNTIDGFYIYGGGNGVNS